MGLVVSSQPSLLRFISRSLPVETRAIAEDDGWYIAVEHDGIELGRRRLMKASCCASSSPCIGPIPVSAEHQKQLGLPAYIHVSICYAEIEAALAIED